MNNITSWVGGSIMINKPLDVLERLYECLRAEGKDFIFDKGEKVEIQQDGVTENAVCFIESGTVFIYNQQKEQLLDVLDSKILLGAAGVVFPESTELCVIAEVRCKGFWLPASKVKELLTRHHLWYEFSVWLTYMVRYLEQRECDVLGNSSYSIVRSLLLRMQHMKPEVRRRLGVLDFIQKRTKISRTVVAEILHELRKGEYIEMCNGKLVQVNHLPMNY